MKLDAGHWMVKCAYGRSRTNSQKDNETLLHDKSISSLHASRQAAEMIFSFESSFPSQPPLVRNVSAQAWQSKKQNINKMMFLHISIFFRTYFYSYFLLGLSRKMCFSLFCDFIQCRSKFGVNDIKPKVSEIHSKLSKKLHKYNRKHVWKTLILC